MSQVRASAQANSVCLLLPGLLHSDAGEGVELPATSRLLSRVDNRYPDARTFEQVAREWFNVQTTGDASCAASLGARIESLGEPLVGAPGKSLYRADPVYQQIDLHHVLLGDPSLLEISTEEAQALLASLNGHLAGDQIQLLAASPGRWYLHLPEAWQLQTTDLAAAIGHNVARHGARGADAGKWRQLSTECQMILFDHPVNRGRERRGQLPINSLWLWGEGELPAPPRSDAITRCVAGDDFYTAGLAAFSSARRCSIEDCALRDDATLIVDRRLQSAANTGDSAMRSRVLGEIEETIFRPIWQNLGSSRVRRVNLWTGRHWWQIKHQARRQFWRRTHPFESFVEPSDDQ